MDEFTEEKWKIKVNPTVVAMRLYDVYPITIARMKKWFFVMRALNPIVHDIMNKHSILGIERALYYSYSKAVWRHTFKYPEYLWDKIIEPVREHFIRSYKANPEILDEIWRVQRHIMRYLIHKLKSNRPTTMEPYVPRKPWEVHTKITEPWKRDVVTATKELDTASINRKAEIDALTKKNKEEEYEVKLVNEVLEEARRFMYSNGMSGNTSNASEPTDDTIAAGQIDDVDINDLPDVIKGNRDVVEVLETAEYYFGKNEGVVIDPHVSRIVEEVKNEKSMGVSDTERKKGRNRGSSKASRKAQ